MQASQSYALYRKNLGDSVISMIVDGTETFSFDILSKNITIDEAEELLTAAGLPPTPIMPVNAYLVQNGQRNILIDAGDANCMGSGGRLHAILAAARIAPCSIDTVLLTHAHPDHIGGLIAQDGSPLFPNAELVLHSEELDFWGNLENFHKFPHLLGVHTLACRTFQAYRSAIHPTTGGPVAPGITLRHLPGHTPGHSGYFIESAGEGVLIWGDIVHWPDIQIPRPEVTLAFDIDPGLMIETRKGLLREIVSENLLVGGMHLNLPGFIRLSKHRDSYEIHEDS
ncbi:MBL fold metallo-hydrolase [Terriglobus sp. ADX1]|uniref:MBL fold metallo-hydrolase n=1 Tax=Terriglobus sp. ADX1 TaxID=2794063 RepID=UPI002FE62E28